MNEIEKILRDFLENDTRESGGKTIVTDISMDELIPVKFIERQLILQSMASAAIDKSKYGKFVEGIFELMLDHWRRLSGEEKIKWLK